MEFGREIPSRIVVNSICLYLFLYIIGLEVDVVEAYNPWENRATHCQIRTTIFYGIPRNWIDNRTTNTCYVLNFQRINIITHDSKFHYSALENFITISI